MESLANCRVDGFLRAPPSKSMMVRAVAAAVLVGGETRIENPSRCEDAKAALRVAEALGAGIERDAGRLMISMPNGIRSELLDCGESALTMRLFSAVAALVDRPLTLAGSGSLARRPMDMLTGPLEDLGVCCAMEGVHAPIRIQGPCKGDRAEVDARESSQFLSGLLMALPLRSQDGDARLRVSGLKSSPYVRMTLELISFFGVSVKAAEDLSRFEIPGGQKYRSGLTYAVEGDWSSAAALLTAGALAGKVRLSGLRQDSSQADRAVLVALERAGAHVFVEAEEVRVEKGALRPFEFDASSCPDLLPPLVALASACPGKSVLSGAHRLRHKESDRAMALVEEYAKMGGDVRLEGDALIVFGGPLREAEVESRGDHRIAMSCFLGGVGAGRQVRVQDAGCVAKSYPGFFKDMKSLGVSWA